MARLGPGDSADICGSTGRRCPCTGASMLATQMRDRVAVAVMPAADRQHGGLDGRIILADRAALPVGVAVLVPAARAAQEGLVLQPGQPQIAPAVVADEQRVRRPRRIGEHGRGPAEILDQQAAALVVDVVGIAVDGRAQADHRLQRRRLPGRHLQAVEAAPGNAHHADIAVAPGLGCRPRR